MAIGTINKTVTQINNLLDEVETISTIYATQADVAQDIATATTDMATQTQVASDIATATNDMATQTQVAQDIATAVAPLATQSGLNAVEGRTTTLEGRATTIEGDITALEQTVADNKTDAENALAEAVAPLAEKDGSYPQMSVGKLVSEGINYQFPITTTGGVTYRQSVDIPEGSYFVSVDCDTREGITFVAYFEDGTSVEPLTSSATRDINAVTFDKRVTSFAVYISTSLNATIKVWQIGNAPWEMTFNGLVKEALTIDMVNSGQWELSGGKLFCWRPVAANTQWEISPIFEYNRARVKAYTSGSLYDVAFLGDDLNLIPEVSVIPPAQVEIDIDLEEARAAGAKYIIVQNRNPNTPHYAELYSPNSIEGRLGALAILPSPSEGLKVLIFGDSITDCATISVVDDKTTSYALERNSDHARWPYILNRLLNCSDLRNYARSGASYCDATRTSGNERENISYQVTLAINDRSNPNGVFPTTGDFYPDIIIFAAGVNDEAPTDTYEQMLAADVKNADDTALNIEATLANLDRTKFYQAARWAYLTIKNEWPNSLILCSTPIQSAAQFRQDRVTGPTHEALVKVSGLHAMPVIDSTFDSGICQSLEVVNGAGVFLADGLHPNADGQKQLARCIINGVKNNYIKLEELDF